MEEIQTWFYMTEPINFISLYVNYQSYSYTRSIAESIKRASPGCMRSTPSSQRLHQQVTMALMQLCQRHSSMYTSCNRMYFICLWTQLSYVKLLLWCCFAVQYPSQSGEHHVVVNSTHSMSNFPWLQYVFHSFLCLVSRGIFWNPSVPSID